MRFHVKACARSFPSVHFPFSKASLHSVRMSRGKVFSNLKISRAVFVSRLSFLTCLHNHINLSMHGHKKASRIYKFDSIILTRCTHIYMSIACNLINYKFIALTPYRTEAKLKWSERRKKKIRAVKKRLRKEIQLEIFHVQCDWICFDICVKRWRLGRRKIENLWLIVHSIACETSLTANAKITLLLLISFMIK